MDHFKSIAYNTVIIVVPGVAIAIAITTFLNFMHRPTLETFRAEYAAAGWSEQRSIAQRYLPYFSAKDLLSQVSGGSADGVCHVQSHAVGRAVYAQTQNFSESISQCGNACTYGCFHGVLMEMFKTDSDTLGGVINEESPKAYLEHVKDVATDICYQADVRSVVHARACIHGLGHVFMTLTRDLPASVRSCDVYPDDVAKNACDAGVFMEYLFYPGNEREYVTKDEGPCGRFPERVASCYQYKAYGWIQAWGNTADALRACDRFGSRSLMCVQALGRAGATENIVRDPDEIDVLCGALSGDEKEACMMGAYMKAFDLYSAEVTDRVCEPVDATHKAYCLRSLKLYHELYGTYL